MFDRFTDRAEKVMNLARQEAQRFNHEYLGTEHVLLGLVKEGSGVGANVLKNLGVDLRKVRLEVEKLENCQRWGLLSRPAAALITKQATRRRRPRWTGNSAAAPLQSMVSVSGVRSRVSVDGFQFVSQPLDGFVWLQV